MVQSTGATDFGLIDLEREIEAEVKNGLAIRGERHSNYGPPRVGAPALAMPNYIANGDGATETGKLSAEVIVREFEAAAKEMEAMGAELIERVKQLEEMTRDAIAVNKEMRETAGRYRVEAKRIFQKIESSSLMTAHVRKTCSELKTRIAAPTTAPS
jgi:hypothetical protein